MISEDKVVCLECGREFRVVANTHLRSAHNISMAEYLAKHPEAELTSKRTCERLREALLGVPKSKKHKKAAKAGLNQLAVREKTGETSREVWNRPGMREKRCKSQKIAQNCPGVNTKRSKSLKLVQKEVMNRPSVRAKESETHSRLIQEGKVHPQSYKCGRFFSKKNGKEIYYQSSYELTAFELLEQMSEVISFDRGPVIPYLWEDGSKHLYHPDILVEYRSGRLEVIEVKPQAMLGLWDNVVKLRAGRDWCEQNGMTFVVWTEEKLCLA